MPIKQHLAFTVGRDFFWVKCSSLETEEAILGSNKEGEGSAVCQEHASRDLTGVPPVTSSQRREMICTRSDVSYRGSDLGFGPALMI